MDPQNETIQEWESIDFTCAGTNADEYRLLIDWSLIDTNTSWTFNYTFNDEWSYDTMCEVTKPGEWWETAWACQWTITVQDEPPGGWVPVGCGDEDGKTYGTGDTDWESDSFCDPWQVMWSNPSFPWQWETATWICHALWSSTVRYCSANREDDDPIDPTPPPTPPDPIFIERPQCEWIDPPSIQIWEYLPIWWEMDVSDKSSSCNSSNVWKINRNWVSCEINLYNPDGWTSSSIRTYNVNCFWDHVHWDEDLINSFKDWRDTDNDWNKVIQANDSNWFDEDWLWEHAVDISVNEFQVCLPQWWSYSWETVDISSWDDRTCQYNFPVTRPYLMQKWAQLSTTDDTFDRFYKIDWNEVNVTVDEVFDSTTFDPPSIGSILDDFVEEYSRLAVQNVNIEWTDCTKIPAREAYYCDENVSISSSVSSEPYTLIVDDSKDLTIQGSLTNNNWMFIVPDWKIIFDNTNCNTTDYLEWIFLADSFETDTIKNNNLNNTWCDDWRLQIKWILRWQYVQSLIDNRRAVIDNWFGGWWPTASDVYDWASLFVQSNPEIWNNLPPAAEGILHRLNIQRR